MMLSLIFKSSSIMELTFLCVVFLTGLFQVDGIMFHLQPNSRKCLREELQAHVVMIGEYEVSEAYGQKVDYVVKDSKGQILTQKADITKGKFTFATETFETCEICFTSKVPPHQQGVIQEVMLITKRGAEAKIYDNYADATKLKPMEAELKRLEDLSEEIVKDFSLMRKNEEDMRNTNESTNRRVLQFTIFSMVCLLGLATWQVFYLRSYFKSKKLIG